jgi:D-alanyl-D-alanine carboxypeptidase
MQNLSDTSSLNTEVVPGSKRRTGIILLVLLVLILIIMAFIFFRIIPQPKFMIVNQQLEHLVTDVIKNNKQIKNCVLYVSKGDGSFKWSGAAGIANQTNNIPMTTGTPVYLASITKIYIAVTVMRLYEQGALCINDPISKYLSHDLITGLNVYQRHDHADEITIEQLLAHTSGIPDYYDEKGKDGKTLFEIFKDNQQRQWSVDDQFGRVRNDLVSRSKPGEKASYSDTNYQLLGKIIEAVTGKPLQAVLNEFFFMPLNLRHTWLIGDPDHNESSSVVTADVFSEDDNITKMRSSTFYWADGGIVSTVEEEVMFLKSLNTGHIIKPSTLDLMHHWNPINNSGPFKYGYGTMETDLPSAIGGEMDILPAWGHSGSTGSFLYYSPGRDLYIAGTVNQTNSNQAALFLMIKAMKVITQANNH